MSLVLFTSCCSAVVVAVAGVIAGVNDKPSMVSGPLPNSWVTEDQNEERIVALCFVAQQLNRKSFTWLVRLKRIDLTDRHKTHTRPASINSHKITVCLRFFVTKQGWWWSLKKIFLTHTRTRMNSTRGRHDFVSISFEMIACVTNTDTGLESN